MDQLPDGFYWAELQRKDPWINGESERQPDRKTPYLKKLCIGIPEQRLTGICELLKQGQGTFIQGAEAALLAFLLNDQDSTEKTRLLNRSKDMY